MADETDVRRIALALPEVTESMDRLAFDVRGKGFAWSWKERVMPKQPRVERRDVLAVRVADAGAKEALLAADPDKFFSEAHYNGFPAVLVRLGALDPDELAELLDEAWRCLAPKTLVAERDSDRA
jgi:hypothetical protein